MKRQMPLIHSFQGTVIRRFVEADYPALMKCYEQEGWMTFVHDPDVGLQAWNNSGIGLVACYEQKIIGCLRALTDGVVTVYVAEILVSSNQRGKGVGRSLLEACRILCPSARIDLLSAEETDGFYQMTGFRRYGGYRLSPVTKGIERN